MTSSAGFSPRFPFKRPKFWNTFRNTTWRKKICDSPTS